MAGGRAATVSLAGRLGQWMSRRGSGSHSLLPNTERYLVKLLNIFTPCISCITLLLPGGFCSAGYGLNPAVVYPSSGSQKWPPGIGIDGTALVPPGTSDCGGTVRYGFGSRLALLGGMRTAEGTLFAALIWRRPFAFSRVPPLWGFWRFELLAKILFGQFSHMIQFCQALRSSWCARPNFFPLYFVYSGQDASSGQSRFSIAIPTIADREAEFSELGILFPGVLFGPETRAESLVHHVGLEMKKFNPDHM